MRRIPLLAILGLTALSGCSSLLSATTSNVAGVASAAISSGITRNAAVGTGIGLAVAAGADAGLRTLERRVHSAEQDQIAAAAGVLLPGQVAPWRVVHNLPIEANQHGQVAVFRAINAPNFRCKEIVFSIADKKDRPEGFYTSTICLDGTRWRWAQAEPATSRWGALQ